MARVAVAMSGGVDSSVAAGLLREAGDDVVGITLQLWDYTEANLASGKGRCCSPADIADARAVAAHLDMPHYVFDHTESFQHQIVDPFLDAYFDALTPSPCIRCNRSIKFGALWELARKMGADQLATGHYARLEFRRGRPQIRQGLDADKDQSYFLFDIEPAALRGVRFPLGGLDKTQVREHAHRLGLRVADKPESYELCFIPDGDKDAFVEQHRGGRAPLRGAIRRPEGPVLRQHSGAHRFTVGQRRGIGGGSPERLYVLEVERRSGDVLVAPKSELYAPGLLAERCNWLAIETPVQPFRAQARIRHRHRAAEAVITPLGSGRCSVQFDQCQWAIAPGQGVAFYDGDLLLGGGWITGRSDRAPLPQ